MGSPSSSEAPDPRGLLQLIVGSDSLRQRRLRRTARASLISAPGPWLREWFWAQPDHAYELTKLFSSDPLLAFETRCPERPLVNKVNGASRLEELFSPIRLESALHGIMEGVTHAPQRLAPLLSHVAALHQRLAFASPGVLPDSIRRETVASYQASEDARFPPQVSVVASYACSRRCGYCFVPMIDRMNEAAPLLPALLKGLDVIAQGKEVRKVAIFGGEPTELPILFDLIDGIRKRHLNIYLATNGLAKSKDFQRLLAVPELEMVTLHVMQDDAYSAERLYAIRTNIRLLAEAAAQPIVRFNLLPSSGTIELLKWSLSKLVRAHLSIAVPFPSRLRKNVHVDAEHLFGFGSRLMQFVRDAVDWSGNRRIVLAKPFPPCALELSDLMDLLEHCDFRCICELGRGHYPSQITLQPNLSVAPCMALLTPERLVKGAMPLPQLHRAFQTLTKDLFERSLSDRCNDCTLHQSAVCQGGCYAYIE